MNWIVNIHWPALRREGLAALKEPLITRRVEAASFSDCRQRPTLQQASRPMQRILREVKHVVPLPKCPDIISQPPTLGICEFVRRPLQIKEIEARHVRIVAAWEVAGQLSQGAPKLTTLARQATQ